MAYGYKPHRALLFSLIFIILGTPLFGLGYVSSPSLMTPSRVSVFESPSSLSQSPRISRNYPSFDPFFYSLDTFIPVVDLYQKNYWIPNANRGRKIEISFLLNNKKISVPLFQLRWGGALRIYLWIHTMAGWGLSSLWVASLTGLIRRP